jgi:hypothetical protein
LHFKGGKDMNEFSKQTGVSKNHSNCRFITTNIPNQGTGVRMLAKCTNPSCSSSFLYLEEGRLFRRESDPLLESVGKDKKRAKYFWLCPACSAIMTLRLNAEGKTRLVHWADRLEREVDAAHFVELERKCGMLLSAIRFSKSEKPQYAKQATERTVAYAC